MYIAEEAHGSTAPAVATAQARRRATHANAAPTTDARNLKGTIIAIPHHKDQKKAC
jgi:hypothetical protein